MKRPDNAMIKKMREELFEGIDSGELTLGQATRRMRKTLGMNRKIYAEKVLKISHDSLQDIETGKGNPTLKTLLKVGKPFGLTVGFVRNK